MKLDDLPHTDHLGRDEAGRLTPHGALGSAGDGSEPLTPHGALGSGYSSTTYPTRSTWVVIMLDDLPHTEHLGHDTAGRLTPHGALGSAGDGSEPLTPHGALGSGYSSTTYPTRSTWVVIMLDDLPHTEHLGHDTAGRLTPHGALGSVMKLDDLPHTEHLGLIQLDDLPHTEHLGLPMMDLNHLPHTERVGLPMMDLNHLPHTERLGHASLLRVRAWCYRLRIKYSTFFFFFFFSPKRPKSRTFVPKNTEC